MEVCFLASGEKVAVLEAAEFEGKTAKAVKQTLAAKIGATRFRQRLFLDGDAGEISDDEVFSSVPPKVQLVVLEFCPPDAEEDKQMIAAARDNHAVALEQLLKCPRCPNLKVEGCVTPLHHAAKNGHLEAMRLLLEASAEIDAPSRRLGRAPLHMAAECGHLEAVRLLIQTGAQRDLRDAGWSTPLNLAVSGSHVDIARFLVKLGADKDELLTRRALFSTAICGSLDMVRFLVELGCDKETTNQYGETPLIAAAQRGILQTVRFLVESGANPHAVDVFGKTALDHAAEEDHVEVFRYLSEFKADSPRRKVRRFNSPRR